MYAAATSATRRGLPRSPFTYSVDSRECAGVSCSSAVVTGRLGHDTASNDSESGDHSRHCHEAGVGTYPWHAMQAVDTRCSCNAVIEHSIGTLLCGQQYLQARSLPEHKQRLSWWRKFSTMPLEGLIAGQRSLVRCTGDDFQRRTVQLPAEVLYLIRALRPHPVSFQE